MTELTLAYNGFHKIALIETEIKGQTVQREKLIVRDSVGALVIDNTGKVGLVRQYRPTVGEYLWEIPAGIMDKPYLTHIETILEELQEECEIDRKGIVLINETPVEEYYMMAGSSDAVMRIYHIRVMTQTDKQVADAEVEEVKWFKKFEIKQMLRNKEIKDSKTKLALNYFLEKI